MSLPPALQPSTVGIDTSVSSPTTTLSVDNFTANPAETPKSQDRKRTLREILPDEVLKSLDEENLNNIKRKVDYTPKCDEVEIPADSETPEKIRDLVVKEQVSYGMSMYGPGDMGNFTWEQACEINRRIIESFHRGKNIGTEDKLVDGNHDEDCIPHVPKTATDERVTKIERLDENTFRETTVKWHLDDPTVLQIVNGVVIPNLRVLLASVLGTVDASVPNKDQNKAIKHLVRKQFDDVYSDIIQRAYPDTSFGTDLDYIVDPEPNRAKAFAQGSLK